MHTLSKSISLFLPNLAGGGAERVMVILANGLADRGHHIEMLLLERRGPYLADLRPEVRIVDLGVGTVRKGVITLARYLRSEKPSILLSALDYANAGALLARRLAGVSTPVVPTVHITHSQAAIHHRTKRDAAVRSAVKRTYPWADAIIAVSRGAAEDMVQTTGVPRGLVRVIYNPVLTPRLFAAAAEPIDHPWFIEGHPPVVVAMGRLTPQKDFPTLLRAASRLRHHVDFRLVILGDGEERGRLENMTAVLGLTGVVALPGFVNNPFPYLARASLFVLSSAWEALPTVLIEALALGVPTVATDCPSGPREILRDGKYGHLVPVGCDEALAAAMRASLAHPVAPVPAEGLQPFTDGNAVGRYEDLIAAMTRKSDA